MALYTAAIAAHAQLVPHRYLLHPPPRNVTCRMHACKQASKHARQHFVCPGGSMTSRPWHKSNKKLTARLTGNGSVGGKSMVYLEH